MKEIPAWYTEDEIGRFLMSQFIPVDLVKFATMHLQAAFEKGWMKGQAALIQEQNAAKKSSS